MREKFIKSTFILLLGGFITKLLGMIIKIVMSRLIGTEGLGLYMLILPTFNLFIGLGQFGIPTAISKLVAEDKKNNKNLLVSATTIILIINIILILLIFLLAPILANKLLRNNDTYYGILAIALVIPFTSISSICRSYFFGKENMLPHVISNIIEDIVRLMLMIIGIPLFINKGLKYVVAFIILSNVISELVSSLILLFFLPRNIKIKKNDLIPNKYYMKECLDIGIFNTTGRLIGSIGYFFEPIILSLVLLKNGYSTNFITREYGILSGYVMPLILLPSFFTLAISNALLPIVAKRYQEKRKDDVKRKIRLAILLSLVLGIPITILFMCFPKFFLKIIYNTTEGINYIRLLAPICLLQYIESPLSASLIAMGKSKDQMMATLLGISSRIILLFILSNFKIGIYGLIIAIGANIIIESLYEIIKVRNILKN